MELTADSLQGKIFWDDFQWYGFILWVILFPIFSIQFTQYKCLNKPSTWLMLSIMPVIFTVLVVTNPQHGLIHSQEALIAGLPFNALTYPFTPAVWIFGIYSYTILTLAFIRILVNFFRSAPYYRVQVGAVVVGAGIPIFATLLVLSGVQFGIQRDITPITLAIGNLFVAWGLLRYQLFDVVPVAWDVVIQTGAFKAGYRLTVRMAQKLGIFPEIIEQIRRGALLHDIGKMAISDEILHKPAPLNDEEWAIMQQHPKIAEDLLSHITYLEKALEIPRFHHERWDGKGYPYGLKGDEIPLPARIFIYIENWDALLSDRPYRKAWTKEDTLTYIKENSGTIFDPSLLEVFLNVIESKE